MISYTSVQHNNSSFGIHQYKENEFIKFAKIHLFFFSIITLKELKMLFSLLLASTIGPLTLNYHLGVNFWSNRWWWLLLEECLDSNNKLITWFGSSNWVLSWSLPPSFWRYKCIEIRPMIALMPNDKEVQNISRIYKAALHCIFLRILSRCTKEALL